MKQIQFGLEFHNNSRLMKSVAISLEQMIKQSKISWKPVNPSLMGDISRCLWFWTLRINDIKVYSLLNTNTSIDEYNLTIFPIRNQDLDSSEEPYSQFKP